MKKNLVKIIMVLGLFCFASISYAQNIMFGAKGGINLASLNGNFDAGYEKAMLTGFHIGGFVDIALNDQFSIVPEVLYSTKGLKANYSEFGDIFGITYSITGDVKFELSYIDIPIMATYKLESGLHFEVGPYVGFLMSADEDVKATFSFSGQPDEPVDTSFSIKDSTASTDVGVAFGLGYQLENGLGFSARYSLGLTDISKESGDEVNKNAVIGISVYYMFGKN